MDTSENMLDANSRAYLSKITEVHERSGLSLREVARECDLDPSYVHCILKGARWPQRDVIIALGFAYRLERVEVDEILLLAGLPPIGRSVLQEFRQNNRKSNVLEEKEQT
jgi:transcriptional regulator with XRE-family HTH domain